MKVMFEFQFKNSEKIIEIVELPDDYDEEWIEESLCDWITDNMKSSYKILDKEKE